MSVQTNVTAGVKVGAPVNENTLLSNEVRQQMDHWLAKYPDDQRQSAVIPSLSIVQEANGGSLTEALMDAVANYIGMPRVSVYEVATFYSMFDLHECGRHKIAICTNISCMLMGSDNIVAHIENKLGCKLGETTSDGRISLHIEEECLAACTGGPMMTVDGHYHERLTPEKVDQIIDALD